MAERASNKSFVWNYYNLSSLDSSNAVCNICSTLISRGKQEKSFTTTSLIKHLKAKHDITDLAPQQAESCSTSEPPKKQPKQATLKAVFERKVPYPNNHPVSERITNVLCEMMLLIYYHWRLLKARISSD